MIVLKEGEEPHENGSIPSNGVIKPLRKTNPEKIKTGNIIQGDCDNYAITKAKSPRKIKVRSRQSFDTLLVEKLKSIINPYTEYPDLLKNIERGTDINFVEELHIDSVDVVEIVVDVETEFGITIVDEELKTFKTFGEMYNLIEKKIKNSIKNEIKK